MKKRVMTFIMAFAAGAGGACLIGHVQKARKARAEEKAGEDGDEEESPACCMDCLVEVLDILDDDLSTLLEVVRDLK